MILIGFLKSSETALICDFAEIYHVLDWRSVPIRTAAALASGLPDSSRSVMKLTGAKITQEIALAAAMVDKLSFLAWAKTKDAQRGKNKPKSILEILMSEKQENENMSFSTANDFDRRRMEILKGGKADGI